MKKTLIALGLLVFFSNVNLVAISHAQGQRGQKSPLSDEARKVWQGEYSPQDLPKWEKRLKKLTSDEKWFGVALCHNVIGAIHHHEGNLKEALKHFNQSLEITRKHRFEKLTARNLLWIGEIQWSQGRGSEALKSVRESVEISQRMGVAGLGLHLLSAISRSKGRYREAMGYAEQALHIAKDSASGQLMMLCSTTWAKFTDLRGTTRRPETILPAPWRIIGTPRSFLGP